VPSRAHQRGVSPSSRHVGRGMRWTRRSKGECSAAYGQVVWSWRRVCWRKALRDVFRKVTVTTSPLHRGEHEVSRKAIAQGMSECSPLTCMLVCAFFAQFGTRDRGCSAHPAFPAPSPQEGDNEFVKARAETRREIGPACFHVIASEAKQSISPLAAPWIASSLRSSQ
jgi:hypothetical protein